MELRPGKLLIDGRHLEAAVQSIIRRRKGGFINYQKFLDRLEEVYSVDFGDDKLLVQVRLSCTNTSSQNYYTSATVEKLLDQAATTACPPAYGRYS